MSDARSDLLQRLEAVVADELRPPTDAAELARAALGLLGEPEPDVRDRLAWGVLGPWLYTGVLSPGEMREILSTAQSDDMLMAAQPVFLRTFSLLVVSVATSVSRWRLRLSCDRVGSSRSSCAVASTPRLLPSSRPTTCAGSTGSSSRGACSGALRAKYPAAAAAFAGLDDAFAVY